MKRCQTAPSHPSLLLLDFKSPQAWFNHLSGLSFMLQSHMIASQCFVSLYLQIHAKTLQNMKNSLWWTSNIKQFRSENPSGPGLIASASIHAIFYAPLISSTAIWAHTTDFSYLEIYIKTLKNTKKCLHRN